MSKKPTIDDLMNNLTFRTIYTTYKNIALNLFVWEGLPKGMKPEYIEQPLYEYGQALFFEDREMGKMVLQAAFDSGLNVYNEPIKFRAIGYNYNKSYPAEKCVNIRNNLLRIPTKSTILIFTNKLVEIERTADVNVKACKTPYIIKCDQNDEYTLRGMYSKINGNEPVIFTDKGLNLDAIEVLQTETPFLCDKLADYRHEVENELLTWLGINNANTDKKERLLTDEVNANNEFVMSNIGQMLQARQTACEEINAMFGLSVTVRLRNEPKKADQEDKDDPEQDQEGGEGNE